MHISFRSISAAIMICLTTLTLSVFLSSCGYHVGSMMHPQIKTIGIADIKNETLELYASSILRNVLADRFQWDGSLKLVQPSEADCILYVKILKISFTSAITQSVDSDLTYRPAQFTMDMEVEYSVRIPGQGEPLIPKGTTSGSILYQFTNDVLSARRDGLKQVSLRIANTIIPAVTEAW